MRRRTKIIWTSIAIFFAIAGLTITFVIAHPEILHGPNWGTNEFFAKIAPIQYVYVAMRDHERNTGQVPQSIEQFTAHLDPVAQQQAVAADNAYTRAILLHDVSVPSGVRHRWMLVLLIPKSGLLGPISEDLIYIAGAGELVGEWHRVPETARRYGKEVVQAAYKQDREGRLRASTRP